MSLIVALYAIKVSPSVLPIFVNLTPLQLTARGPTDSRYSYGWHRAEILAALINGVFLLALCFSISLEALERFFSTPGMLVSQHRHPGHALTDSAEISSPKLVVIVGSLGLASNIVGLFLFHGKPSTLPRKVRLTVFY